MSKETGLGDRLFIHAYDLSGDVGAIQTLGKTCAEQIVTGIDKSAAERLLLLPDGEIGFNNYFNPDDTPDSLHEVLNDLPATDRLASYFRGIVLGTITASLVGKQVNYGLSRNSDGGLLGTAISIKSNGYELEYGEAGTPGPRTDEGPAATPTGFDGGLRRAPAANIVSSSIANPTNILCAGPHGLSTGDYVTIAGHVGSDPDINGDYPVTVVDAYNFTIVENVTVAGTGGTAQPIIAIVSSTVHATTTITTQTAHGLVTGDWIVIAGHDAVPDINKAYVVTYVSPTTFTIPVEVTEAGTAVGTVTRTSTKLGLSAYLHLLALTGDDITVTLEHSADNAATDAYVAITLGAFAEKTAVGSERIETADDLLIRRWIRVVTSGTFDPATLAVAVCRK